MRNLNPEFATFIDAMTQLVEGQADERTFLAQGRVLLATLLANDTWFPAACAAASGGSHIMQVGDIEAVSPTLGDWHRVSNADLGGVTVSIHVYGGSIGTIKRSKVGPEW